MSLKVFIPTAGTGSRLGGITKHINKSLVGIANSPALSRIIDAFPADTRFVIAIGYKGEIVKEFLSLAYPEREIELVDVYPYEGKGSGLGLTMLFCKEYLQEPFIFCSCDTLVSETIPPPTYNWMGYDNRDQSEQYRTISITDNYIITHINEKGFANHNAFPYIGLAGVFDYKDFWTAMDSDKKDAISQGESFGMRALLRKGVRAEKFTWFDIGIQVELEETRKRFQKIDDPNILEKPDEAIWFCNNKVIKYSNDSNFIADRVKRAKMLKGFVPQVNSFTEHMYCYTYVEGTTLSKCITIPMFKKLLEFSNEFWVQIKLNPLDKEEFYDSCMKFYRDKTYERVKLFYDTFSHSDDGLIINGIQYPTLSELLDKVNWEYIANGLPGQFHGDFHFENILYIPESDSFGFLDWRQNFDKSIRVGDIYYDFAKLLHGLIITHELIAKNAFNVIWHNKEIRYDFFRRQNLLECEQYYCNWLDENNYDKEKVYLITALIFLNIAGLHHHPYCELLYALGKKMLFDSLERNPESVSTEYERK